jgi:hypothetical protein
MVPSQQALRDSTKSLGHQGFAPENGILRSFQQHCNNMAYRTGFQASAMKYKYLKWNYKLFSFFFFKAYLF